VLQHIEPTTWTSSLTWAAGTRRAAR
jgi:hypothetical protein